MKASIGCLVAILMVARAGADTRKDDLDALLGSVAEIGAPGSPGPLCVWGPEAFPVIVGIPRGVNAGSGVRAAVVAASRWQAGRVVALGHGSYFSRATLETADTGSMMTNALRWAAGGLADPRIGVVGRAGLRAWLSDAGHDVVEARLASASLQTVDVVAVDLWKQSESEIAALSAFVRAGGGLVTTSLGWTWANAYPNLDLTNDHPGNRMLAPVGIQWHNAVPFGVSAVLDRTSQGGYAVDGPPDELTHAARALDAVEANGLTQLEIAQATYTLTSALRSLPPDDTMFAPRLHALIERGEHRWPSADYPIGEGELLDRLAATLFVTEHLRTPAESVRAHPAVPDFPGTVPADAPRLSRTLTIEVTEPVGHSTSSYSDRNAPRRHSTGLYAAPGELVTVTVPSTVAAAGGVHVRVGAHSDDISVRPEWTRMPVISRRFPIFATTTLAANAFGGLIYVEAPLDADLGRFSIRIEGAVAAPLFVLGETDPASWRDEVRHAPAPWAEIAGRNMIVTTPASEVRGLDDPAALAETWDRILDLNAELAAWPSPARLRRERFVVDRQISYGYMRAGYPIRAHLDQQANVVDADHLRSEGNWGVFHEVGHNHQSRDWTFDGTLEVNVNLFTLYVYEFLCGKPVAESYRGWADARTREMIARNDYENLDFEEWKRQPALALYMYVQLQQAFGWEAYRQVFATYRALSDADRPKSDDEKRDQWLVRFSRQVGRNLGPFFEAWGVPTSVGARASIADLPVWLPSGFSTLTIVSGDGQRGAPGGVLAKPLVVEVRDQYGNLLTGASVTFKVAAGAGKLSGRFAVQQTTTDADGRARLIFTLGPDPGPNTVSVFLGERELTAFQAQGVGAATMGLDEDYRKWHLPDGANLRLGKGVLGQGDRAVALSADGRVLAVASGIGVWLYEAATSRTIALLPTERPAISVAFSIDGLLAAGTEKAGVQLWDVETGASIGTLRHPSYVTSVVFSPDGTGIASASWDQVIKLWDIETMREVGSWELERQGSSVWFISLDVSPDGSTLASGLHDGTVRLWDVATRTKVATLEGHEDRVTSVSFSPDGALLASAGERNDRTVRLWDVATRTEVATLRRHTGDVRSVSFSFPDGATLASAGGWDATVRLWDVAAGTQLAAIDEHAGAVGSVTFSRDGGTLASGSADGTVLLRDMASGNVAGISGHSSMSSMALSPDAAVVALGYKDGKVGLWDAAARTRIATLKGHSHDVLAVSFGADGKTLASASGDRTVRLWDAKTGTMIAALEGHTAGVTSVAFSTDGTVLASGTANGNLWLWDTATWRRSSRLDGHTDRVASLSFSADGELLASGSWDRTFKIWNVNTRVPVMTRHGHTGSVHAVTFSPDGKTLASGAGDGDGTVRLWDLRTGTNSATFKNPYGVYSLAFFPDGELLASGIWYSVTVWDVNTQEQIGTLEGYNGHIHSLAISRDGGTLATGASDGTMLLWDATRFFSPTTPNPDFDSDGTVGFGDFVLFAAKFGLSQGDDGYHARYDLDGNGAIGFSDFLIFAESFGKDV